MCLTSPTTGAVLSGFISEKLGGYDDPKAPVFCLFLQLCACGVAAPMPFISNFYVLTGFLWFYLLIGGCLAPMFTGIMLAGVEPEYRP